MGLGALDTQDVKKLGFSTVALTARPGQSTDTEAVRFRFAWCHGNQDSVYFRNSLFPETLSPKACSMLPVELAQGLTATVNTWGLWAGLLGFSIGV